MDFNPSFMGCWARPSSIELVDKCIFLEHQSFIHREVNFTRMWTGFHSFDKSPFLDLIFFAASSAKNLCKERGEGARAHISGNHEQVRGRRETLVDDQLTLQPSYYYPWIYYR
jgi:hypothetical protein